jgi:hypothetical protein
MVYERAAEEHQEKSFGTQLNVYASGYQWLNHSIAPKEANENQFGAGQAGVALSYCLQQRGVAHLILERDRPFSDWYHHRWDSFEMNTPNWMNVLPGATQEFASGSPRNASIAQNAGKEIQSSTSGTTGLGGQRHDPF